MYSRTLRISGATLLTAILFSLAACGGYGGGSYTGSGQVATITIAPATATITVNGTQQYTAVAKDSSGNTVSGVTYTWASSSPAVATVNANGLATGVAAGTTMITASVTYSGGIYGMGTTITSNAATLTVSAAAMAVGTMAVGRAVPGAVVSLKDSQGQPVVAMTDGNGRFQIATSGLSAGFLLMGEDNQGHVLFSFAANPGNMNITPLTDLMVRIWYQAHGTTAGAAFANPAAHPVPQAAQLAALNQAMVGLLAGTLSSQGLDPASFNLIATPFVANGSGFDAVLDHVAVSAANGEILLRDTLSQRETTITFDLAQHAVAFSTVDLNGQTAAMQANLVLP
ncbi:MAG: Ig-like domain-containing protein [Gammaproteobacteria bacterium]|nr:Ig-like domain-containing protein [Gammaproteobacteria bacterium]MDE1887266.1 Ig-like domain-containing protein [Gammaproteobacteria bacterium]MDE2023637.1 Ig-like domain-containing protein [Gammaproteobacteria bacterium]MDE2139912.1 Ig-like domain-containing protein [Gammaproteobacteria bacterium]MDE2273689.1 Ig-like domain-containing protein [Gammaproteobacteria bacterium]